MCYCQEYLTGRRGVVSPVVTSDGLVHSHHRGRELGLDIRHCGAELSGAERAWCVRLCGSCGRSRLIGTPGETLGTLCVFVVGTNNTKQHGLNKVGTSKEEL